MKLLGTLLCLFVLTDIAFSVKYCIIKKNGVRVGRRPCKNQSRTSRAASPKQVSARHIGYGGGFIPNNPYNNPYGGQNPYGVNRGGGYGQVSFPQPEPSYPTNTGGHGFEEIRYPGQPAATRRPTYPEVTVGSVGPAVATVCSTAEGYEGLCRPGAYCYFQYDNIRDYQSNQCIQSNGVRGICCPNVLRPPSAPKLPIEVPKRIRLGAQVPQLSVRSLNQAAGESRKIITQQLALERQLVERGFFQSHRTSEAYHQAFFGGQDEKLRKLTRDGLIGLETTIQIAKRYYLQPHQARDALSIFSLYETQERDVCPVVPRCTKSKYRTPDGSCNNLRYPLWGRSHTAFTRLVPPAYADGLNELRRSITGEELPGPRSVSTALASDQDIPHRQITLAVMQWGQFIDHDLTLTASTRVDTEQGEGLSCCREELITGRSKDIMHPACKPIMIPSNDRFYSQHRQTCINFVRNAASPRAGCTLGPREQMDQLTQVIDASNVYGSTPQVADHLRSFQDGLLRSQLINGVEYLPYDSTNRSEECAARSPFRCFVGGDVRVNEQTGLTMEHMVWLREHNRIAKALKKINPYWDDETIYQETRRIVAAQLQHITYNEWMPIVLGRQVMKEFGLMEQPDAGFAQDYDEGTHPGIINAFATAAYRFHTLIQGIVKLMNNHGSVTERLMLRNLFNNPESIYRRGAFDEFINAFTGEPAQTFDGHFTEEITNHLFQEEGHSFGMDLIALNIQRGRDHGLPGWNAYRKICGLPVLKTFAQADRWLKRGQASRLSKLYRTPDDVDLFIAGNNERALPGALVGPTFACILAEQARRNKVGDRFWYENGGMIHSFSPVQLKEIRKASLAGVYCHNSDNIQKMQQLAFYQPADWNPKIDCDQLARVDFTAWKDEPSGVTGGSRRPTSSSGRRPQRRRGSTRRRTNRRYQASG